MKRVLIGALLLAAVLAGGCIGTGSRTCSDGSFVVGAGECPAGETFEIEILSHEAYGFGEVDGRITGKLRLEYRVLETQPIEHLAVYPVGREEAREFLGCRSAGHCEEVIDWYRFPAGKTAVFRFCRYGENGQVGDFGICRDFTVDGFVPG